MKKIIFIASFLIQTLLIAAQQPVLTIYQAFDGRFNNEEGVTISEIIQPGNYYYSIRAQDNQQIIDQLLEWAESGESLSNSITKNIKNGKYSIVYQVPMEEAEINVGIRYPYDKSKVHIFLQSYKQFMPKK